MSNSIKISKPEINMPKGGGNMQGMGGSFKPNFSTGTGSYTIPIPCANARGFEPTLNLQYASSQGNGVFGLGFTLSLGKISVNTSKGIPKYDGTETFILEGLGTLVKKEKTTNVSSNDNYIIINYLPIVESSYIKIEQWISNDFKKNYWKIQSRDNVVTYFGQTSNSRIFNPDIESQIFEWLIDYTEDSKGNKIVYEYYEENNVNVSNAIYEVNRSFIANRYIAKISYGNFIDKLGVEQFAFHQLFDYSGLPTDTKRNIEKDNLNWACRIDPFSTYRSGFEIRTFRLCHAIILIHNFPYDLDSLFMVKSLELTYISNQLYNNINYNSISKLQKAEVIAYRKDENGIIRNQRMPATDISYSTFSPPQNPIFQQLNFQGNITIGSIGSSNFLPIDLYAEGLPGFLFADKESVMYLEPLGAAKYGFPNSVGNFPITHNLQNNDISIQDIDGNGQLDVVLNPTINKGFYENGENQRWKNYTTFNSFPTDYNGFNFESVDLNARGKSDLITKEAGNLLVYFSKGKLGYEEPQQIIKQDSFPINVSNSKLEKILFADLFGDGLSHRVLIKNGTICAWPCLGHGKFGKKITFENAPFISENFDVNNILLADIDGSGLCDIIILRTKSIDVYFNENGNSFSKPLSITLPFDYNSTTDQIQFIDILGNGTTCLVLSSLNPTPIHYYYNFNGDTIDAENKSIACLKPYLLTQVKNNLGAIVYIQYASSTKFALEDKRNGYKQIGNLRSPVQVVEKVTMVDRISSTRTVSKYKYHDGYFDPIERTFSGFGFVESWDTETFLDNKLNGLANLSSNTLMNDAMYTAPVYTKTWYYNGSILNEELYNNNYTPYFFNGDVEAMHFPLSHLQKEIVQDSSLLHQAYNCLKGSILRKEIYGEDSSSVNTIPYSVDAYNYNVNLLQSKNNNDYAVLEIHNRESISYQYERNQNDPRISQSFTLEVDPNSGDIKKSVVVYLPRRKNSKKEYASFDEQYKLKAICNTFDFYNSPEGSTAYWRGVQFQEKQFEIFNLNLNGTKKYFTFDDINAQITIALTNIVPYLSTIAPTILQAQQIKWECNYFWNNELTEALLLGQVATRNLLHHTKTAVFTKEIIKEVFADLITDKLILDECGYLFEIENGYWWNYGLTQYYNKDKGCFFMPSITSNSFVNESSFLNSKTVLTYDFPYCFYPVKSDSFYTEKDYNSTQFFVDYQTCKYFQSIDCNNNLSQLIFDPLGNVIVTTLQGTENAILQGGMLLYPFNGNPATYIHRYDGTDGKPISFDNVLENQEYYLQGATSFYYYDLYAFSDNTNSIVIKPTSSINLLRNDYYLDKNSTVFNCQVLITYIDGKGRSIEKKQYDGKKITNALKKITKNNVEIDQWLVSGKCIYNNKEKVCVEYIPTMSDMPYYEGPTIHSTVAPKITIYDAIGRVIRVDTPKGFFTKTIYESWEEKYFDEDDTILDSSYYKEYYPNKLTPDEKNAIEKAIPFFDTPTIKVQSNMGTTFLNLQLLSTTNSLITYEQIDIEGRVCESIDPRFFKEMDKGNDRPFNFKYVYPMSSKKPIQIISSDGGFTKNLDNIFDKAVFTLSKRNYFQYITYDKLMRQNALYSILLKNLDPIINFDNFNLVEIYTYGETVVDAADNNLNGVVYKVNDLSGVLYSKSYSMQGSLLESSFQVVKEYKIAVNWKNKVELEKVEYAFKYSYDAIKHLILEITPDGSVTKNTYNIAGLLDKVEVKYATGGSQQIINNIYYNPLRQKSKVVYGNSITETYIYEETTQRLLSQQSTRNTSKESTLLKDIKYYYDPVGNITRCWDNSVETVFSGNQKVAPLLDYTYDAIYQLIKASGRQHKNITANTYKNNKIDNSFMQSIFSQLPSSNDKEQLVNYTEEYIYDESGNLVSKKHNSTNSFIVDTPVEKNSNRLLGFAYDASGNQTNLFINNKVSLVYNCCENLVQAVSIERPNELTDSDYYLYNASENRVRKITEKYSNDNQIKEQQIKLYFGNYEVLQIKKFDTANNEVLLLERNAIRVMDNKTCVATSYYWKEDVNKREVENTGTRSTKFQLNNSIGSITMELDEQGQLISYEEYFPFGGTSIIAASSEVEVVIKEYRYSGKECDSSTGMYYYGVRYYVTWLGRWNKPDPAGTVDGLNVFAFVKNNPISSSDEKGMWQYVPTVIGGIFSAYTSYSIAKEKNETGMQLAKSTLIGAGIGVASGGVGGMIAKTSFFMSQTVSMVVTSTLNSGIFSYLNPDKVSTTTSFGAVTYDWKSKEVNYPFKSGNSILTNISLLAGASANVSDIRAGFSGTNVVLVTEFDKQDSLRGNIDFIGHSAIVSVKDKINISVGPAKPYYSSSSPLLSQNLARNVLGIVWDNYFNDKNGWTVPIYNVNKGVLLEISNTIASTSNKTLQYSGLSNSCVGYTSRALLQAGIPTAGGYAISPYFLHAYMAFRQLYINANPFQTMKIKKKTD